MDLSETIVVYDIKVGRCGQLNEYMNLYEYQRPMSFSDFGQGHSDSTYLNFISLETAGPIKTKFHVDGGTKVYTNGQGHMTDMAAMSLYFKNLKNILVCNQKADDLQCWYAASSTQVLTNLIKLLPWVDLGLFYGMGKFVPLCFCLGKKGKTMDFSETIM